MIINANIVTDVFWLFEIWFEKYAFLGCDFFGIKAEMTCHCVAYLNMCSSSQSLQFNIKNLSDIVKYASVCDMNKTFEKYS